MDIVNSITGLADSYALILIPIVVGLTQIFKNFLPDNLTGKLAPVISVALAVAGSLLLIGVTRQAFIVGAVIGLSAAGLYSGGRAIAAKTGSQGHARFTVMALLCLLSLALIAGCGASVQTKVTKVYTATAPTINAVHDVIVDACGRNVVSADRCASMKAEYNKAAAAYKKAGDLLMEINTISEDIQKTVDATKKTTLQEKLNILNERYPALVLEASNLITMLIGTLQDFGVSVSL